MTRTLEEAAAELLTVTQEDRESAAEYYERRDDDVHATALRDGYIDDDEMVEAFARHRLNTRPSPDHAGLVGRAKAAYIYESDNHPTIHSNRFVPWEELSDKAKKPYIDAAALSTPLDREAIIREYLGNPSEEMIDAVAKVIMVEMGCGLTVDSERVFCDSEKAPEYARCSSCECPDTARAAIAAIVTALKEKPHE